MTTNDAKQMTINDGLLLPQLQNQRRFSRNLHCSQAADDLVGKHVAGGGKPGHALSEAVSVERDVLFLAVHKHHHRLRPIVTRISIHTVLGQKLHQLTRL